MFPHQPHLCISDETYQSLTLGNKISQGARHHLGENKMMLIKGRHQQIITFGHLSKYEFEFSYKIHTFFIYNLQFLIFNSQLSIYKTHRSVFDDTIYKVASCWLLVGTTFQTVATLLIPSIDRKDKNSIIFNFHHPCWPWILLEIFVQINASIS